MQNGPTGLDLHLPPHLPPSTSLRDEWLTQLVDELDEADSYEYLKHLTDVYRLHLFDAIMQYRAIFFDSPVTQVWASMVGCGRG